MLVVVLQMAVLFILLVINGVFAMSEIAMFSSRKVRLQQRAEDGDAGARAALLLIESPVRFLSTVQIGITLVGILTGMFGGATIAGEFGDWLARFPVLTDYAHAIAYGIVVVILTFFSLLIGELVPKQLALGRPETIASMISRPMNVLSGIVSPGVSLLSASTRLVLRCLGVTGSEEPVVTVEDIQIMLDQGKKAGVVEDAEHRIFERVFRLDDRRVSSLLTPRTNIVWIDLDEDPEENWRKISTSRHSYFPACRGDLQTILGIISLKDVLQLRDSGEPFQLADCLHPPLFVPPTMSALKLLEFFKQTGRHIAVATDEYGTVQGLVTVTDVIEAIVGDIPATGERPESPIVRRQDGTWLLDGMLPIDELKRVLGVESLPAEEEGYYHTLGGFVVMQIGRIPAVADTITWNGIRFEVMDMDGRRVDKVLVVPRGLGKSTIAVQPN